MSKTVEISAQKEEMIDNKGFLIAPFVLGFSSHKVGHIINKITLQPICNTVLSEVIFNFNCSNPRICKKCLKLHAEICKNERVIHKYD